MPLTKIILVMVTLGPSHPFILNTSTGKGSTPHPKLDSRGPPVAAPIFPTRPLLPSSEMGSGLKVVWVGEVGTWMVLSE